MTCCLNVLKNNSCHNLFSEQVYRELAFISHCWGNYNWVSAGLIGNIQSYVSLQQYYKT